MKSGCIYMGPRRYAEGVVWPHGYFLNRRSGEIAVLDEDGVVAQVGEEVRMGGGEITQGEAGPTPEVPGGSSQRNAASWACPAGARALSGYLPRW